MASPYFLRACPCPTLPFPYPVSSFSLKPLVPSNPTPCGFSCHTYSTVPIYYILLAIKAQVAMWLVHTHFALVSTFSLPFSLPISLMPLPAPTLLFLVFPSLLPLHL